MAISRRGSGAVSQATTGGTLGPLALPAGHTLNDILIAKIPCGDNVVNTMPAGWTRKLGINNGAGCRYEEWWKRDNGAETTPTVTRPGSPVASVGWIEAYSGVDPGLADPYRDAQTQVGAGLASGTFTITCPALTGVVAGDYLTATPMFTVVGDSSGTATFTTIAGWTEDPADQSNGGGANEVAAAGDSLLAAGSAGAVTSTAAWNGGVPVPQWVGAQSALNSATTASFASVRAFQEDADPRAYQVSAFQRPDPSDAFITRLHAFFQEGAFQRPDPTGVFQFSGFDDEGFQADFEAFYATMFQPQAFQIDEPISSLTIVSGVGAIGTGEAFGGTDRVIRWIGPAGVGSAEQFGVAHVTRWLGPAGIASAETFGTTKVIRWLGPAGLASLEQFGTAKALRLLGPAGVASGQAFGTTKLIRWIGPGGAGTGEAFGTTRLIRLIFPLGIASSEAFGRPMEIGGILGAYQVTGVGAVASLEQFGAADKVIRWVGPGGSVSAQAFGVAKTVRWIGPGGVGSGIGLGGPGLLRRLAAQGVASAELVSVPRLVRVLAAVNVATGEAFGLATLSKVPVGPGSVFGSAALSDLAVFELLLVDRDVYAIGLIDVVVYETLIGDREAFTQAGLTPADTLAPDEGLPPGDAISVGFIQVSDRTPFEVVLADKPGG